MAWYFLDGLHKSTFFANIIQMYHIYIIYIVYFLCNHFVEKYFLSGNFSRLKGNGTKRLFINHYFQPVFRAKVLECICEIAFKS